MHRHCASRRSSPSCWAGCAGGTREHSMPALEGRTPLQAWLDDPTPLSPVPAGDLRLLMLEDDGRVRKITTKGVSWRGRSYVGPWMTGQVGRTVRLRWMPHHEHEVEVFDARTHAASRAGDTGRSGQPGTDRRTAPNPPATPQAAGGGPEGGREVTPDPVRRNHDGVAAGAGHRDHRGAGRCRGWVKRMKSVCGPLLCRTWYRRGRRLQVGFCLTRGTGRPLCLPSPWQARSRTRTPGTTSIRVCEGDDMGGYR